MKDFLQVFSPSLIPHLKKKSFTFFPVLKIKTKKEDENPHPNKILLAIIMSKA